VHDFSGGLVPFAPLDGTDVQAACDGMVSITPLMLPSAGTVPAEVRRKLEG